MDAISQLANSLQQSIPQAQEGDRSNLGQNSATRSSTPLEPMVSGLPLPDEDEEMEEQNASSNSRKRSRGGKKHAQANTDTTSANSEEVDPKLPRRGNTTQATHTENSVTSPRGRGRPPGSLNKKFEKKRSSTRINNSRTEQQRSSTSSGSTSGNNSGPGPSKEQDGRGQQQDGHNEAGRDDHGMEEDEASNEREEDADVSIIHAGMDGNINEHDTRRRSNLVPNPLAEPTSGPAPWSTEEVEAISEAIGLKCAGGSAEHLPLDEPGLHAVSMDYLSASNQGSCTDLNETRTFDMRDLVTREIDIRPGSKVKTRDVIQFVVLAKPRKSTTVTGASAPATKWTVPEPNDFHDIINRAECYMIEQKLMCYKARKWSNLWGKVGLIGLSPKFPEQLEDYRTVLEGHPSDEFYYTIFPREAVENRGSVSLILREQFRAFSYKCLPASLFSLNPKLQGSLRVTHQKTYSKDDKTRGGQSKEGWRLILLQGCPAFMRSLEQFDEDTRFSLGSGYVYIRGGVRKPRSGPPQATSGRYNNNNDRPNTGASARGNPPNGPGRRHTDPNKTYEDNYPRLERTRREGRRDAGRAGGEHNEHSFSTNQTAGRGRGRAPSSWGGP